jgi:outer membrane protein assembly factor BamB
VSSAGETKWKHPLAHCGYAVDIVAPDDAVVYVAAAGLIGVGDAASGVAQDCSRFSVVRLDGAGRERWRLTDRGWSNTAPRLSASASTVVVAADGPDRSSLLVGIDATAGRATWSQRFDGVWDALRPAQNARTAFWATNADRLPSCVLRATETTHGQALWEKTISNAGQRCRVVRMWATDAELVVYGVSSSAAMSETRFLSVLDVNGGELHRHHEPLDFDAALRAKPEGVPALKTGEVVVEFGVGENVELLALDPSSGQARWLSELRSLDDRGAMVRLKDLAVGPDAAWVTGYFARCPWSRHPTM